MKQSYLTIWVSACLCMCLSLCGNVSAQGVTSFSIQRPDFADSAPEDLYVTLRDVPTSGTETGMEMYAAIILRRIDMRSMALRYPETILLQSIIPAMKSMYIFCPIRYSSM